ncbi:MAG TPA: DUF3592 domain-containing protein [Xanthobacteraceae bacterium]|nr:DUF3592 domain-containing protein [Xanthobacteraceae bacterium]
MIAPYVIAGVLLLLAAGCALGILHWLAKAFTMSRWPTVKGTITSSWDVLDGERIKYAYAVGGRRYVGHMVALSGGGASTFDATPQELVEKYPPGAEVTVYYNPTHCATAVLEPRSMKNAGISILFTVAFASFGLLFLAAALRAH